MNAGHDSSVPAKPLVERYDGPPPGNSVASVDVAAANALSNPTEDTRIAVAHVITRLYRIELESRDERRAGRRYYRPNATGKRAVGENGASRAGLLPRGSPFHSTSSNLLAIAAKAPTGNRQTNDAKAQQGPARGLGHQRVVQRQARALVQAGECQVVEVLAAGNRRIAQLEQDLARWRKDGASDPGFLACNLKASRPGGASSGNSIDRSRAAIRPVSGFSGNFRSLATSEAISPP